MGKLIVIEGMDGVGTTTQTRLLAGYLQSLSYKVMASAEPTKGGIGQEIRKLLKNKHEKSSDFLVALSLCFAADRMLHVHDEIKPGLIENDFVILDRYVLSSLVYQGLHVPTSFVKDINQYALKPDMTIILDLDPDLALERIGLRAGEKDFYETPAYLKQLRQRYLHFQKDDTTAVLVDARGSVEQVQSHIQHIVNQKFL